MANILIQGCPGTGKTLMARALGYYMCKKNLSEEDAFNQDPTKDETAIDSFINDSGQCEFIQVHPSMDYDDIVYGMEIEAGNELSLSFTEKRILTLCNRATGKDNSYCVILDDINRTNASVLLGNLLYAMEYRNQEIELPNGKCASIPDNVILIFTEDTLDTSSGLDLGVRRRMTYLKELKSSREILSNYYKGCVSNPALKLILDTYDRIAEYINSFIDSEAEITASNFIPGHGMFIVPRVGNTHYILDNFRQKIRFQISPYLMDLYSRGLLKTDPSPFIEQVKNSINVGISGVSQIESIKKKLIRQNEDVTTFSLVDSRDYYVNNIVANGCVDYRGMMECVIDAMILNNIFPYDVLFGSLLQNTNIAYIEALHIPGDKAAYIVEKGKANRFQYETVNGGKTTGAHSYYSLETAATGKWAAQSDTEEYVVSYNNGSPDKEFIPLSGFRNHGFNLKNRDMRVEHNTTSIMPAIYFLLDYYYEMYETDIELVKGSDPQYEDLYNLIRLEHAYLTEVKNSLKRRDKSVPNGDKDRLAYLGQKIQNLRLLWNEDGTYIEIDESKFEDLVSGHTSTNVNTYEDLYNLPMGKGKSINIKGVLKMVDLTDYQKIMENIGIRQMIFQGPPGTSKTFESKRFVLQQLHPSATALLNPSAATQEVITNDLDPYKLTDEDYANPKDSKKLVSGGWDLVQFHPSYGYEDFIRGIEVKIPEGQTTPSYESVNCILGKIADFAKTAALAVGGENAPKFYLIVDEINRANLATVFGELIYGLEYRESRVSTPYEVKDSATGIYTKDMVLGNNLYIIGTMNTADKSIDSIDYAIRRRFIFIDSPAQREVVLKSYQSISGNSDDNSIELLFFDAVQHIFDGDRFFNNEYQKNDVRIGHTYFLRSKETGYQDAIIEHFVFQVIPILREYLKDGVLDVSENLIPEEHTVSQIKNALDEDDRIELLSENIMLYVKEFGNPNKSNETIDNKYIGEFIDKLRIEFDY